MDTIAENKFEITKDLMAELTAKTIHIWYKCFCITFGIAVIGYAVFLAIWFYYSSTMWILSVIMLCMGVFLVLWPTILFPRIRSKRHYQLLKFCNNGVPLLVTTHFYEDRLEIISPNGGKTVLEYKNVKKDYLSKNLYIIVFQQSVVTYMRKDSFTKGTLEDVKKLFLINK